MGAPVVPSLIFPINDWSKNRYYVLRPTIGNKCEINVQGHYLVMNFVIGWHVLSLMFFWRGGESESTLGVVLVRAVNGGWWWALWHRKHARDHDGRSGRKCSC